MTELKVIKGRVWKFGDNISTTDITPQEMFGGHGEGSRDIVFGAIRPEWKLHVKPGDCIVAGKNFGFGSHRSIATDIMKDFKIGCIVAESMARVYYRTSIASGFPVFVCPGVSGIFNEGDELELDVRRNRVRNLTTGQELSGEPYPPLLLDILESGGMMPLLVKKARALQ